MTQEEVEKDPEQNDSVQNAPVTVQETVQESEPVQTESKIESVQTNSEPAKKSETIEKEPEQPVTVQETVATKPDPSDTVESEPEVKHVVDLEAVKVEMAQGDESKESSIPERSAPLRGSVAVENNVRVEHQRRTSETGMEKAFEEVHATNLPGNGDASPEDEAADGESRKEL